MKHCNSCNTNKPLSSFYKRKDKWQHKCKSCEMEYKLKNKDKQIESKRKHYLNNTDKIKNRSKAYKAVHRKRMRSKLFETRPMQKVLHYYRSRLNHLLKGKVKGANTIELVGCNLSELKTYLESKFKPGMTWENYGEWHIDHIIPCSKFDFNKKEDQEQCFHYTNLQPLWALENILKSDKILNPIQTKILI